MIKLVNLFIISIAISTVSCETRNKTEPKPGLLSVEDRENLTYLKEVEWPKAYREQDTILLDHILGDDFQMIDQNGNWYTKADELDWIKKNATQHDSFQYKIKRLDILPNGTALVCGTGHIVNDTVKSIYQSSNILVKRNGQWKAVASHVSGFKVLE